ncbi:hypothetical protein COU61_04225 [Candidatus Pacearchaeota archaeon CG10_big_fil_rev_8_21_14_0_10_35_13]|nr:MAG: hypothetical protein COU61_04225 [Candidatus Pacearchaeota archaeon CG10_big_fil_rev_8_21_14_0_10_35_13]
MADSSISTPGGFGGLMRYNEEYPSRFKLRPAHVVGFVISIIIFVVLLNLLFPLVQ